MVLAAGLLAGGFGATRGGPAACPFSVTVKATPGTGIAPLEVQLNASVTSGSPSAYDWSFGDGSFWNGSGAGAVTPLHRYGTPGSYDVEVAVVEPTCTARGGTTVIATPGPLAVTPTATPSSGPAPLTVALAATISGGSGTYVSVFWSFGDGGVGSGDPVVYTYSRSGSFTATVNVTDSAGHWAVASVPVTVRGVAAAPPAFPNETESLGIAAGGGATLALLAVLLWRRLLSNPATLARSPTLPLVPDGLALGPVLAPRGASQVAPEDPTAPDTPPPSGTPSGSTSPELTPAGSPRADSLRLTQRVILHIGRQGRTAPDDLGSKELTQGGIAVALGIGQNSVTNVLRRLVAAGVLVHDVRHVSGQPRRLRVYRLTERGEGVFRDLWARSRRPEADGTPSRPPD
ncbi:MAG TPA: PKD domain-containing protein [Thermoplasmata archaeon]|nr:PKD domain-containing protein [Thermoplasmata archaeon]